MTYVSSLYPDVDTRTNLLPQGATLADILELSRELESPAHVHDHDVPASQLAFDNELNLSLDRADPLAQTLQLERRAWSQMAAKLGKPFWGEGDAAFPHKVTQRLFDMGSGDLAAEMLNRTTERAANSEWKVRGYDGTVRAIVDKGYPAIANYEVVDMVKSVVDAISSKGRLPGMHLDRSYLGRDTVYIRVAWSGRDTPDGPFERFTLFGNGNVGDKSLFVMAGVKRGTCDNSIVFAYQRQIEMVAKSLADLATSDNKGDYMVGMSLSHSSGGEARRRRMLALLAEAITKSFNAGEEMIDMLLKAYEVDLSGFDMGRLIDDICSAHGWSEDISNSVKLAQGSPDRMSPSGQSLAGLVNRVTYAAARTPDYETGLEMETLAGDLLAGGVSEVQRFWNGGGRRRR